MLFLQSAHRPKIHASRCVPRFFAWPPSQKPQLSSSQRFDLRDRVFCLTDGFVPNGNANLGRPPRQPGHRPHRKHGQAMGGMNLEDFLAGGGGGMAMAAMGGLLLSMALGDH